MNNETQKLYCYVDESGQDTQGALFLVSVVIAEKETDSLREKLVKIEKESGKMEGKWHKTSLDRRVSYIRKVFSSSEFKNKILFSIYRQTKEYVDLTILTTAKAVLNKASGNYKVTVIVDGLSRHERRRFASGLRRLRVRVKKVRGAKDENDPLIRLADAAAGFFRDHLEGEAYAAELYKLAISGKVAAQI